jgi:hypothetical protein
MYLLSLIFLAYVICTIYSITIKPKFEDAVKHGFVLFGYLVGGVYAVAWIFYLLPKIF